MKMLIALAVVAYWPLSTLPAEGAETNSLRAGAAKIDITPTDFTGFYSVWAKPFERVLDPIYVRALVVDNGTTRAAIVATDLVEFGDTLTLRQRIERELAIRADHIIISASHDHNAPRGGPIAPGTSPSVVRGCAESGIVNGLVEMIGRRP